MKHNWEYKRLGDVATYVNGYAFKPTDWIESGYPIIRIQNLNNSDAIYNYSNGNIPSKYFVSDGDLLISWSASLGAYIWHGEKAVLNQHIFKVIFDKTDIIKNYLKYFVDFSLPLMASKTHGATMRHITKPSFDALPIPFPKLEVQEQIVAELDKINEVIADCRELLRNLDALEQSLFYDTFGDPVTNPKGWEIKKLDEICRAISTGITYKPDNVADIGTIVLRSSNIQNSSFVLDDIVHIDMSLKPSQYVQKNDILMCSRNGSARLVGKVALIPQLNEKMSWGAFMTIIRSDYYHYLFQFFRLPAFREQLTKTKTTTVNQITIGMLKKIQIPMPPLSLQEQFASRIEQIEAQKKAVEETIENLQTLLDSRMDYWFN